MWGKNGFNLHQHCEERNKSNDEGAVDDTLPEVMRQMTDDELQAKIKALQDRRKAMSKWARDQAWAGGSEYYTKSGAVRLHVAASQAAQKAAQAAADQELLRLEAEAKQRELAVQFEEQAYADPVDDACGIDVDRVRRLNLR